jgi:hypothetical protein
MLETDWNPESETAEQVALLTATQTLTNKTLTSPVVSGLYLSDNNIIVEGTDDTHETTLTFTDPTADRTITFKDATGTVAFTGDITSAIDALTTSDIEEGTNLYYTDERAQDAVGNNLSGSNSLSAVYTDSTGTWAETLMFLCILSNIQPFTLQFEIKDWYYKIHNFTREQVNTYLFKQIKEEGGFVQLLEKLKPIEKTYPNFAYEYEYSDYLAKELKGQREVNIPNGRIDILTETEIIEVKEKVNWLEAAEQVNRYHLYFPSLSKRIFLFGKSKKYTNQYIEEYCTKLNILVSFVDN